jgi:hypothetical protein
MMSQRHENTPAGDASAPSSGGTESGQQAMSGLDTGTAPWGVSGEGDARHGDAADAGGDTDSSESGDGSDGSSD